MEPPGPGYKNINPKVQPLQHSDSSATPYAGSLSKRKPGRVHRAVGNFLSVILFFGILVFCKILLFISLCISLVPQDEACEGSVMNTSILCVCVSV